MGYSSNVSNIEKSSQIDKFNFTFDYVDAQETDQSEVVNDLPILEREPSLTVDVTKSPPLPLPLSLSPVDSTMLSEIAATTSSTQEEEIVQSVITTPPLPLEDADQVSEEKPKIVIDKVITASGNIVDAKSYDFNSSANDSQMLDINSMPLVVSDLNTSNCATGSSTTIISVPIASKFNDLTLLNFKIF